MEITKTPLNEFIIFQRGFDLPKNDRIDGDIPVIASTGIAGYHNVAKVESPGVVIGRSGSIGGGQYIEEDFWPLNTTLWIKDFKGHNERFIYYLMRSINFSSFNVGSGVPTLNRNHLSSIKIEDFGREYEDNATKILGDLDDRIKLNQQTNKTLEKMAQALFKSWFVDFDPVIDNALAAGNLIPDELQERAELRQRVIAERATNPKLKPLPDDIQQLFPSEFEESGNGSIGISGWIPKGWANKPLYDLGEFINGAAYKKFEPNKNNEGLPIVKIAELKSGITANTGFSAVDMPKKYHLKDQDILFSWSGNPETSIDTFVWALGDALLNQHIFKVVPNRLSNYSFLFALLKYLKPEFTAIARDKQTTGLGHVTVKNLKELFVVIPSDELLTKFEEQLKPILNRIFLGLKSIQSLGLQRDFLLPKLISGQITINKDLDSNNKCIT
jgi:type I restriction enzyme S subunit